MDGADLKRSGPEASVVDVGISVPGWRRRLKAPAALCRRAARAALAAAGRTGPVELSLLLADDETVRRLNRGYRGKDEATNVLAFPAGAAVGAPPLLGDVVLALETVVGEAAREGRPLAHHAAHLIVHGVLHLLGYDHRTEAEERCMNGVESRALARLGVPDPHTGRAPPRRGPHRRHEQSTSV